jgi:prophage DNA circulation protein
MSAELSGRMDSIESQMTYLIQDLLQKIDLVAAGTQATNWNQQFDQVDTVVSTMKNQLQTLQSLYSNLYMNVQNIRNILTGHTGSTGLHN